MWTLQGLDVLGGSAMSGVTLWAVIGPLVAIAGLWLAASGFRPAADGTSDGLAVRRRGQPQSGSTSVGSSTVSTAS